MMQLLDDNVMLRPLLPAEISKGGIIIPDTYRNSYNIGKTDRRDLEKTKAGWFNGEVVALGKGKRLKNGSRKGMELKIGDKVLVNRLSAAFGDNGQVRNWNFLVDFQIEEHEEVFIVRESDCFCVMK